MVSIIFARFGIEYARYIGYNLNIEVLVFQPVGTGKKCKEDR
jgi:hypothetical protein